MAFEIFRKKPEPVPFSELEDFLTRLEFSEDKSNTRRAYVATYLKTHEKDIEEAVRRINEDISLGGHTRARKLKKLIEESRESPAGYDFDLKTATLRSFRPAPRNTPSFTLPAEYPLVKRAGYIFAAGMIAGIIWSGIKIKGVFEDYVDLWLSQQEEAANLESSPYSSPKSPKN